MINKLKERIWRAIKRPESDLYPEDMEWIGTANIMRAAKLANTFKFGKTKWLRNKVYRSQYESLLQSNGPVLADHGFMKDGILLDTSGRWPHLLALLDQCEKIIAQNGMTRKGVAGREWIRDIMSGPFLEEHPALLDFITTSDVMKVACEYLNYIPTLSATVPPGLRLTESHQDESTLSTHIYSRSQLFHLDIHDSHMVYVIVLLRDVTERCGPFCYLDATASDRVVKALGYRRRGKSYRLSDEEVFNVVDRSEMRVMTGKAGTVLFIDPSRCFHYGSRNSVVARYQAMYALVSPCRADFTEWYSAPRRYPVKESDSRLRRLVLEKTPDFLA